MRFRQNEARQAIFLAEGRAGAIAVLLDTGGKIGRDADIEDALWLVGHDVNATALRHALLVRTFA